MGLLTNISCKECSTYIPERRNNRKLNAFQQISSKQRFQEKFFNKILQTSISKKTWFVLKQFSHRCPSQCWSKCVERFAKKIKNVLKKFRQICLQKMFSTDSSKRVLQNTFGPKFLKTNFPAYGQCCSQKLPSNNVFEVFWKNCFWNSHPKLGRRKTKWIFMFAALCVFFECLLWETI